MDLQLVPSGMGPAMMKLDLGVLPADVAQVEFIEEWLPLAPEPPPQTWRQRAWAVLNMDVRDVWRLIRRRWFGD